MDKELLNKLPLFPINRHGKRLTEKQLEKLIELIAMEKNKRSGETDFRLSAFFSE